MTHLLTNRLQLLALAMACLAGLSACATAVPIRKGPGFQHYLTGNATDVSRPTSGLWVLQGGGDDVDENYVRMGAKGGGGDFVVLRASGGRAISASRSARSGERPQVAAGRSA